MYFILHIEEREVDGHFGTSALGTYDRYWIVRGLSVHTAHQGLDCHQVYEDRRDMKAQILLGDTLLEEIDVDNGLRQGCCMA